MWHFVHIWQEQECNIIDSARDIMKTIALINYAKNFVATDSITLPGTGAGKDC